MKTLKLVMIAVLSLSIIFTGCKKDDDNNAPNQDPPEYKTQQVDLPDAMENAAEPGAQMACAYVAMANTYSIKGGMMVPPGKSVLLKNLKDGTPWTYTWDVNDETGNFSVTMTITEDDVKITWEMRITGMLDGINVTNFLYLRGIEYKDGSYASFESWDPETGELAFSMTWSDTNGVISMELIVPEEIKLLITVNPDGAGNLEFYEWVGNQWMLEFEANWTAAGTGAWWEYDNGVLTDNGTWP